MESETKYNPEEVIVLVAGKPLDITKKTWKDVLLQLQPCPECGVIAGSCLKGIEDCKYLNY